MDAQPAQNTNSPQISVLGNIYNNIKKGIDMGKTLIMLQGSARCFAAGTKVRMYDGSLKNIEDIVIGDKVLDMYGNGYNVVTDTHSGYDMMYRVTQPRGDDYVVNSRHILSLKQTEHFQSKRIITDENGKKKRIFIPIPYDKDAILDISVEDYIRKSRNFRRKFAGFKNTKVTALPKQNLKIDPYYLGYWLGNGTSKRPTDISTIDTEIIEWFESFAQSLGVTIHRRKCNYSMDLCYAGTHNKRKGGAIREFCDAFRHYNLYNNKHVPSEYIYGDYEDRLRFLAGLIDSDGYDTRRNTLGITQKNTNIAEAIVEICRLSGFYTNGICKKIAKLKRDDGSVYECEVNLIEINHNDFNDLNKYIKVPRKRIHKQCERDYFTTKIHVEKIGVGKFYGFTLDGEPHFLLRDGTIVHNSGKTRNTMIFIVLQCLNEVTKVSVVRQSLPVIKRSVLEDFKIVMRQIGQWDDRRFNKTESIYQFPNGSVIEFFSADDNQKLRGPYRDILYVNEANEISYDSFSALRQRTYKYTIVDYNPSFTEEHWLFPLMSDKRSFHFISTFRDNIFLPKAVVEEIESYQTTNPALWQIFGLGQFAIVDGLVFPKENWDIIPNESYPSWKKEEVIGLDWGFVTDPSTAVGVIILGDDIYVREIYYEYGLLTKDIADRLEPYSGNYKYCDIDNRLITELEMNGVTLLYPTKKNGESILSGIRIMNQKHIHITESSTDIIKEFRNYVYKKDRQGNTMYDQNPVGKFDHCFSKETLILTKQGNKKIIDVKCGDLALTTAGWKPVMRTFANGEQELWNITLHFNRIDITLDVTPAHKIKTTKGWKEVRDLQEGDVLFLCSNLTEKNMLYIEGRDISHEVRQECTSQFGDFIMGIFQKVSIYITKTRIHGIMTLAILNFCRVLNIFKCTLLKHCLFRRNKKNIERGWITREHMRTNGTKAKTDAFFTKKSEGFPIKIGKKKHEDVFVAGKNLSHTKQTTPNSAAADAKQDGACCLELITRQDTAQHAARNLQSINTPKSVIATENVLLSIEINRKHYDDTYNLMIDEQHEYFANGVLVSNCVDAIRYAVLAEFANAKDDEDIPLSKEALGLFI